MEAWREQFYDEIYHHGILGQKWGRQNGPPYPLGASDHSASEKKAGWHKSLGKTVKDYRTKKKRQKAAAKARKTKEKKAQEAAEKAKNMKNPAWLQKHANELSNDELKTARERLQLENDLRQQSIRRMNAGKEYIDLALGYAKSGIDVVDTASNVYNKVKSIQNKESDAKQKKALSEKLEGMSTDELLDLSKRTTYKDSIMKSKNAPKVEEDKVRIGSKHKKKPKR